MKKTYNLPSLKIEVEITGGDLPKGTDIFIKVPLDESKHIPIIPSEPEEPVSTPLPEPLPDPQPQPDPEPESEPQKTFRWSNQNGKVFNAQNKDFIQIGNPNELNLSGQPFSIEMEVKFHNFDRHHRVVGSLASDGPGSSLQLGVLKGGNVWMDTFMGALTGPKLEIDRWYRLTFSLSPWDQDMIFVDNTLAIIGSVPNYVSDSDLFIGKWVNTYADFTLKRLEIKDYQGLHKKP